MGFPQQLNVTHSKEKARHFELLPYPQSAQTIWGLVINPPLGTAPRRV